MLLKYYKIFFGIMLVCGVNFYFSYRSLESHSAAQLLDRIGLGSGSGSGGSGRGRGSVDELSLGGGVDANGRVIMREADARVIPSAKLGGRRINACLYILIRNMELEDWVETMKQFEAAYNHKHNYPYLFMNDVPFTDLFVSTVRNLTNATVEFGLVPPEHWSVPDWIDKKKLDTAMRTSLKKVFRGTMMSYHHMCRYYSGFFFRQQLSLKYDYFWRLEPGVRFPCSIDLDPFEYLIENNKLYGFSITRPEWLVTIPSLWSTIIEWLEEKREGVMAADNSLRFISNSGGRMLDENLCTFFNNFEIAAFSVFRDPNYVSYFEYLDKSGGFYYERWGDSAVNSFYLNIMLNRSQVHFFESIAYFHQPYNMCPRKVSATCDCVVTYKDEHKKYPKSAADCLAKWKRTTGYVEPAN